ncbi:MAG: PAS domain-containing sensor histidine kinase [Candidatus Accumulibacter sp.]|jgi:two-component system nitrogen regulation sensor histidine kinase GlnL|nr:PAS domain-containing sensor histidine kinase [Accumulibacter sp.]
MSEAANGPFGGLDLLSSAVILLDAGFCIRHMNPAAELLFAVSGKTVRGCRLDNVAECPGTLTEALANALAYGWDYGEPDIEIRRIDDAALHLDCSVSRVDAGEVRLLVEFRPIDPQILRATREERLAELQLASRELIRNLAHEIKNPLGGIRGAAQLLEHELGNPGLHEYTQVIIKEADRLQDLMKRLLSPHRPMQPGAVNIHEILERVRSLLTAEFPGSLSIRRDYDTSLPELVGDREQLIQAALNIARNAAQAIVTRRDGGTDGRITLRTRVARQVTLARRRFPLALELKIIDDGPGVPDDIRERVFYPLVSGRDGGSGLGLTLAQNFIQQHQGTIECESRPGYTCFTIRLPFRGQVSGIRDQESVKPIGVSDS